MFNRPYTFKGNEYISHYCLEKEIPDSFSYQFVVLPDPYKNNNKSPYLISPIFPEEGSAGIGIKLNGNEVQIIECTPVGYHTVIQAHLDISTWLNLIVVYSDKKPSLYVNGELLAVGKKSSFNHVYFSGILGGNDKGECFKGKLKSVRFWEKSLNNEEIIQLQNEKAKIEEVMGSRNFIKGNSYHLKKPFTPKVTVIIPTYNKYSDLLLTLHSLECQTFNKEEFEVILCDDGSDDHTIDIHKEHKFSFPLTYIRANHNMGRPNIRNLGLLNSSGEIIIFLDAEVLVQPDFITEHYLAHKAKDRTVVCGSMVLHGVYTKYHPNYNEEQLLHLQSVLQGVSHISFDFNKIKANNEIYPFLSIDQVYDQTYKQFSFEKPFVDIYRKTIFNKYGNDLSGFHFPWILFCTGNVSVQATGLKEAGLFEEYPGYGWDDHEMGYRLYKIGYTFLNQTSLIAFHQEHPVSKSNNSDAMRNFVRMFNKYPEIQMRIFALHFLGISLVQINDIFKSYLKFESLFPNDYSLVKELFIHMLIGITVRLWQGHNITNLLEGSTINLKIVQMQTNELIQMEEIKPFALCFKQMLEI